MESSSRSRQAVRALRLAVAAALAISLAAARSARADEVTVWNVVAGEAVAAARLGAPPGNRVMALVHAAVYEAALAAGDAPGVSVAAAIAASAHATLLRLVPAEADEVEEAYRAALGRVADGPEKASGVAAGEAAAAAVLARRGTDGAAALEAYRPRALVGVYVPTTLPAVPQWPGRTPWLMASADAVRPGPPPRLDSATWARDYNETRELGARSSTSRGAERTEMARFWESTAPPIYQGIVRSLAERPGRAVLDNARLFAATSQACDDAMIAVFDAKYHYELWRPITAIRNGDLDGNDATVRDPSWTPLIDTPMHPEYPCAHCILAAAVGAVLEAELEPGRRVTLTTTSPSADGAARAWASVDEFVREVATARIAAGVHFRNSTEVGAAMGRRIGALAAARFPPR